MNSIVRCELALRRYLSMRAEEFGVLYGAFFNAPDNLIRAYQKQRLGEIPRSQAASGRIFHIEVMHPSSGRADLYVGRQVVRNEQATA